MWSQPPDHEQSHIGRNIIIAIGIIALVVVAAAAVTGIGIFFIPLNRNTIITSHTQIVQAIVSGVIRVEAGSYNHYQFTTPVSATNVHMSVTFNATGGNGNDIQVLIMDQPQFVNWQNNQEYRPYYNSGQANTRSFDIPLPPGEIDELVYSNTFSAVSAKDVQTSVTLYYNQ